MDYMYILNFKYFVYFLVDQFWSSFNSNFDNFDLATRKQENLTGNPRDASHP